MGISLASTTQLLVEAKRRPFSGSVLTLGKQNVRHNYNSLKAVAKTIGVSLDTSIPPTLSHDRELAEKNFISDDCVFRSLGLSECYSLDCSDFEGADFVFDMNRSDLPANLVGRFDVIYDGGTIEHCFHLPNLMNNIFTMLRPGGRIIHVSPSSNFIDHGFFMFSPTFFWDFYCANQFELNTIQVVRHTQQAATEPWELTNYVPGVLDYVAFGGLDEAMYAIVCVATKTERSTGTVIPVQSFYLREWRQGKSQDTEHSLTNPGAQLAASLKAQERFRKMELEALAAQTPPPMREPEPSPPALAIAQPKPEAPVVVIEQPKPKRSRRAAIKNGLHKVPPLFYLLRFGYRVLKKLRNTVTTPAALSMPVAAPIEPPAPPPPPPAPTPPAPPKRPMGMKIAALYEQNHQPDFDS